MKIKMLKTACGPHGSYVSGVEYTLAANVAISLIDCGAAEAVKAKYETTSVDVPEKAVVKKKRTRKKVKA